jgi:hypothetical protein
MESAILLFKHGTLTSSDNGEFVAIVISEFCINRHSPYKVFTYLKRKSEVDTV